jgi:hypothetical protein
MATKRVMTVQERDAEERHWRTSEEWEIGRQRRARLPTADEQEGDAWGGSVETESGRWVRRVRRCDD